MNAESVNAAKIVLADIAGLTVFSNLCGHPLIKALAELLLAVYPAADSAAAASRHGDPAGSPSRAFDLCRRWAAFTDAFIRLETDNSFAEAVSSIAQTNANTGSRAAPEMPGTKNIPRIRQIATAADLERLRNISSLDIARLGFDIAAFLRSHGLISAAQHIEAEAKEFW